MMKAQGYIIKVTDDDYQNPMYAGPGVMGDLGPNMVDSKAKAYRFTTKSMAHRVALDLAAMEQTLTCRVMAG
jgi:hypothetical protein